MLKYYVKVLNGIVLDKPKVLSDNSSDFPNKYWKFEQMKLNGFFIVDLDCDPITEYRDLNNPIISENSVVYPIVQRSINDYLPILKNQKFSTAIIISERILLSKYPLIYQIAGALTIWGQPDTNLLKNDAQVLIDRLSVIKNEINNLTSRQSIENYEITFPTI